MNDPNKGQQNRIFERKNFADAFSDKQFATTPNSSANQQAQGISKPAFVGPVASGNVHPPVIFSDKTLPTVITPTRHITAQQPTVTVNFAPQMAQKNSIEDSRLSIVQDEIVSILKAPEFAENILKMNKNLEDSIAHEVKKTIFQEQKKYIDQQINEDLNFKIQKEITDFKIHFSSYFEDVLKARGSVAGGANEESIARLEQEVSALKLAQAQKSPPMTPIQSPQTNPSQMASELQAIRAELAAMRADIQAIRQNEQRMQQRIEENHSVLNPNTEYIEEIGLIISRTQS